jgi:YD repeat-containing protein
MVQSRPVHTKALYPIFADHRTHTVSALKTQYSYAPVTGELLAVDYSSEDTADIRYSYDRLGRQTSVEDATGLAPKRGQSKFSCF